MNSLIDDFSEMTIMCKTFSVNGKEYAVLKLLGKGKGGYSYLVEDGEARFVLKQIHHEPCDYYQFGDKLRSELHDYETLSALGIPMPRLLSVDESEERILKEYVDGETVAELINAGEFDPRWLDQVHSMCALLYPAGLNIDYYPTNFVCEDGKLYYIDYECNSYMEKWDFEHWGSKYWAEKTVCRGFRDGDYDLVCDFLIELNKRDKSHINWNWARFEWMFEHPEFDKSLKSSIGLWLRGGKIVGAAIYDMYFGEAFCGALPEYPELYTEALDYAYDKLRDGSGLGVAVCDGCEWETSAAKKRGFFPYEQAETMLCIDLSERLCASLPAGYGIAELDPAENAYEFQWLLWRGFDHGEDRAEFEREGLVDVPQNRRHFNRYLSLAAVSPEGEYAAYACLWYSEKTDYAYVEPVCTVPAFRGRGLAGAILSEALNRASSLGAKKAYVISDMEFYRKLGFRSSHHFTFYRKA
ncbi:MAG: GNAT family N-acetyltransferase [Oscillospiraceae bacterium]|nr:GNAT family N-acetyltransferase [Oscillospiraceae bacterium]